MNRILVIIFLVLCCCRLIAQNNVVASNGVVPEVVRDPYFHLRFNADTSTLMPGWIGYLDEIGTHFSDALIQKGFHYIELTPMLTGAERTLEKELVSSRTKFITDYLLNNYDIGSDNILIRRTLFDQKVAGVTVVIMSKEKDQLTRGQLRELKRKERREHLDEDEYFREDSKQTK